MQTNPFPELTRLSGALLKRPIRVFPCGKPTGNREEAKTEPPSTKQRLESFANTPERPSSNRLTGISSNHSTDSVPPRTPQKTSGTPEKMPDVTSSAAIAPGCSAQRGGEGERHRERQMVGSGQEDRNKHTQTGSIATATVGPQGLVPRRDCKRPDVQQLTALLSRPRMLISD